MFRDKKILVCDPHTDDSIVACGGTLQMLSDNNCDITIISFSYPHKKPEILTEHVEALSKLSNCVNKTLDFPIRKLNYVRQDILELLYSKLHLILSMLPTFVLICDLIESKLLIAI